MGDTQSRPINTFGARAKKSKGVYQVQVTCVKSGKLKQCTVEELTAAYRNIKDLKDNAVTMIENMKEMKHVSTDYCVDVLENIETAMDMAFYYRHLKPITDPSVNITYRLVKPGVKSSTQTKPYNDVMLFINNSLDKNPSPDNVYLMKNLYDQVVYLSTLHEYVANSKGHLADLKDMLRTLEKACQGRQNRKAHEKISDFYNELDES